MFVPFQIGKYAVIDRIRVGGMGELLYAQYVDGEGDIARAAIKRPLPSVAEIPDFVEHFWDECHLLERIKHPAFPRFIEAGISGTMPFLAMEFIKGRSLGQLLRCEPAAKRVDLPTWIGLAVDLCDAVAYLHQLKTSDGSPTLHGDIHPSNVLVSHDGQVRLLDLGIASLISRKDFKLQRRSNDFQAPFIIEKAPSTVLDTYAIGRCLLECLGAGEPDKVHREGYSAELQEILARAVDRGGLYNYNNAADLGRDLAACIVGRSKEESQKQLTAAVFSCPLPTVSVE
jgi:serine/threonine-protein kinase